MPAPKKTKKVKRSEKGGKLQKSAEPPPPSHQPVNYSHWDKIKVSDDDSDQEKPQLNPIKDVEEGIGSEEDEDEASNEDDLQDFPPQMGLGPGFGKLLQDPAMMKKLNAFSESIDGPLVSNVSRVIPPSSTKSENTSSKPANKGSGPGQGSKSSSGKASAFNLKFDEKEAVAKLSTAAKNPEIMKLVGDRLPMSDNRPAKETPKINTPEEGETMYSNVFPGLISDEEEVEPYKESKANGSMAEELADVLMEARAKGIAHSYKGSASASKFSAPSKKAKKGTPSEAQAQPTKKDQKEQEREAEAAYKALLEEEEKEKRAQQEKEERKQEKKKKQAEKKKAQKLQPGDPSLESPEARDNRYEHQASHDDERPSDGEATIEKEREQKEKEKVGELSMLEILKQTAASRSHTEKEDDRAQIPNHIGFHEETLKEKVEQKMHDQKAGSASAGKSAAKKSAPEQPNSTANKAPAGPSIDTKDWTDGLVPKKPAASSKKKKKQKQKEEARVSETVETPDIVTPSIPAEFRESTAEPSSNSSAKEEKTQDDKESAAVQEIEAGIQTLHVEEVSDDEEPQPPQDSQIEGSSVRSDIGEDELESEHVSDNPFDLLLNPNGRRPPQDLPKGNGQTNRRKSRGGGREPTISGGAYDSESSNSTSHSRLGSGAEIPVPNSRPKPGTNFSSQMPRTNGYAPPDLINTAKSVWGLLDSAMQGNSALLGPAIDAANEWIKTNEKSQVFRPVVAQLRKRVEVARPGGRPESASQSSRPEPIVRPSVPQRPTPATVHHPQRIQHQGRGEPVTDFHAAEDNEEGDETMFDPFGGVPMGGRRANLQQGPPPGLSNRRLPAPPTMHQGSRQAYRPGQANRNTRGQNPNRKFSVQDPSVPPDDRHECIVCLDWPPEVVLEPCGHTNMCRNCAEKVRAQSGQCPTCRLAIKRILEQQ